MITVEQARQLVGPDSRLSNAELEQMVAAADVVADLILDLYIDQHRRNHPHPTATENHLDRAA